MRTRRILLTVFFAWLVAFPAAIYSITCERALSEVGKPIVPGETRQSTTQIFNETIEQGLSKDAKPLVDRVVEGGLLPDGTYLNAAGVIGQAFDMEVKTTADFIANFQTWKQTLRDSGKFSHWEIERMGMDLYIQALLRAQQGQPTLMTTVFNTSLVVDDLYGSHLFEMLPTIELGNVADFMALRRKLAVAQGVVFLKSDLKDSHKVALRTTPAEQAAAAAKPVERTKDGRVLFIERVNEILDADHLPFKGVRPFMRLRHEIMNAVEPSTHVDPIGRTLAKQYLEQPWVAQALGDFKNAMAAHKAALLNPKREPSKALLEKNVFDLAMEVTKGDRERAVVLVGLMSIQRKALNRGLSDHYAAAGTLDRYAQPLLDTVSVYYQITELAEVVDSIKKKNGSLDSRYTFLYPAPYHSTDNKFYHFWSEAFFAQHLRGKDFPAWQTQFGLGAVGTVYEAATSVTGLKFYQGFGMNRWQAFGATKMFDDMALHRMGAAFGSRNYDEARKEEKLAPAQPEPARRHAGSILRR